jgi:hypothetical protein
VILSVLSLVAGLWGGAPTADTAARIVSRRFDRRLRRTVCQTSPLRSAN